MPKGTKIPRARFNLKQQKPKDQPTLISLLFRYRSFLIKLSTGFSLRPDEWDKKRQRPVERAGRHDLTAISRELDALAQACKDLFIEHGYGAIPPDDFKEALLIRIGRKEAPQGPKIPPFFEFADDYLEEIKRTKVSGSHKVFTNAIRRLREYVDENRGGRLHYDDVDWNFRKDLLQWMYEAKEYEVTFANKILSVLSMFLNEAAKRGYHQNTVFRLRGWREKVEGEDAPPVYLTVAEVEKLAALELEGTEKRVRDLFLIGLFTGQRWSDFHRYRPEQFIDEDGEKLLRVRQQKTGTTVYIPLDLFGGIVRSVSLPALLEEYGYQSPSVTYNTFNPTIQALCERIGMTYAVPTVSRKKGRFSEDEAPKWQEIGSHCCRRTFCTLLYKAGFSPAEIMPISGHKTESQFYQYIGLTARENARRISAKARKMRDESPALRIAK